MKKAISFVLVAMLALSISACGTMKSGETMKVKCPACGYEFDLPKESVN